MLIDFKEQSSWIMTEGEVFNINHTLQKNKIIVKYTYQNRMDNI